MICMNYFNYFKDKIWAISISLSFSPGSLFPDLFFSHFFLIFSNYIKNYINTIEKIFIRFSSWFHIKNGRFFAFSIELNCFDWRIVQIRAFYINEHSFDSCIVVVDVVVHLCVECDANIREKKFEWLSSDWIL